MSSEAESRDMGRKPHPLRLALGLLLGGGLVSCTTLFDGWRPTILLAPPLSLLLVLAATIVALFAWREPRSKLVISLGVLALMIGMGADVVRRRAASVAERVDDSVLPPKFRKLVPLHQKLGKPQPGDWLIKHPEFGQAYDGYVRMMKQHRDGRRHVIYVQPLGEFTPIQAQDHRPHGGIYGASTINCPSGSATTCLSRSSRRRPPGAGATGMIRRLRAMSWRRSSSRGC